MTTKNKTKDIVVFYGQLKSHRVLFIKKPNTLEYTKVDSSISHKNEKGLLYLSNIIKQLKEN